MEKQTFKQINEQATSAYMNGSDALPTVLIERSDKRITVGNLDQSTGNVLFTENGQDKMHPSVSRERLTDAYQAELAERLAEKPLENKLGAVALENMTSANVPAEQASAQERESTLRSKIDELIGALSTDDKNMLFRYSMYKSDKANAQQEGDGHASELAGQYMGQEYTAMSADAQRVADQYDSLLNQLSRLRRQL